MRSQRRLRLYVVVVVVFLLAFTYFTTDTGGGVQSHRFYKTTVTAMNNAHAATPKKNNEAKDRSHIQRLDLENNNNNNNGGARKTPSSSSGSNEKQQEKPMGSSHSKIDNSDEISVAGRTKMSVPKPKGDQVELSNKKTEGVDNPKAETETHAATEHEHETSKEDKEEQEASDELDSILKRSPIIVFSKSYCPYSRKAKSILGQYHIVPTPHIVELDKHPLGPNLQKLLGKVTGRRTVPNVLINGVSIGGGDDVEALDRDDTLISKIKSVGGKSIMEIERLPAAEEGQEHEI